MLDLNKVLLAGNLVRDPEAKTVGDGIAICGLRLAVNRQFTDRQGKEHDEVCFVDVETFRGCAESCQKYLRKASPVLVEGRLKMDQWDDRETGKKVSRLKVVADMVHFLGGGEGRRNGNGQPQAENGNASRQTNANGNGNAGGMNQANRQPRQSAPQRAA